MYMGVSTLIMYWARAEMPNAQTWGVTAGFLPNGGKQLHPKLSPLPNSILYYTMLYYTILYYNII